MLFKGTVCLEQDDPLCIHANRCIWIRNIYTHAPLVNELCILPSAVVTC